MDGWSHNELPVVGLEGQAPEEKGKRTRLGRCLRLSYLEAQPSAGTGVRGIHWRALSGVRNWGKWDGKGEKAKLVHT